ncbi:MAG: universal stress protein [Verrucomicrobiae bacterium]|nr:universal stress protein [Verrucomicrobiae bacterium]
MQIVCGTDFSPNATEAAAVAAVLARAFADRVVLTPARAPSADARRPSGSGTPSEAVLRAQLEVQKSALAAVGVSIETRLDSGSPVEVLKQIALPDQARMIVLSSIGQVALARVLLGSTADRVAESAPVPTLVVRSASPFTAWVQQGRALRILAAVDRSAASDSALAFVKEWIQAGPVNLMLAHVAEDRNRGLERQLAERAGTLLGESRLRLRVVPDRGAPSAALIALAGEHRADLLVTGTHQRRGVQRLWHRSVSRALLADAPMSVAVVPVPPGGTQEPIPTLGRILAATDLSPAGNRALPAACALLPAGGVLRILHVLPAAGSGFTLLGGSPHTPALTPGERKVRQQRAEARLRNLVPAEAAERGIVAVPAVVEADDVASAILAEAARFGAQALCLGSRGRGGVARVLLGSVTATVLQRSPVPVHVIPPPG